MNTTDALYDAVENLVKVKGRHHTEQAYQRLVKAFDAAKDDAKPAEQEKAIPANSPHPLGVRGSMFARDFGAESSQQAPSTAAPCAQCSGINGHHDERCNRGKSVADVLRNLCCAIRMSKIRVDGRSLECEFADYLLDAEDALSKSLTASVADALRPFLAEGQKVIWREAFRWHDDDGVLSNHYEMMSVPQLAEDFGYIVIEDCGCAAIVTKGAAK